MKCDVCNNMIPFDKPVCRCQRFKTANEKPSDSICGFLDTGNNQATQLEDSSISFELMKTASEYPQEAMCIDITSEVDS